MTVTATTRKRIFDGDNSTTVFPWNFKLTEESQMHVYIGGTEVLQGDATYPWTISGVPGESGNVTFTLNPPPTGTSNVLLVREMTFDQQTDYQDFDPFPAETHEAALDKLTMQVQEVEEEVSRATKTAIDDETGADYTLPQPVADSVIGIWNAGGTAIDIGPTANEISNAQANATAAAASASAAATSETNAAASAAAAAASAADAASAVDAEMYGLLTVSRSGAVTIDMDAGRTQYITVTGNWTSVSFSNMGTGKRVTLILEALTPGDKTIVYNAAWKLFGNTPNIITAGKFLILDVWNLGITQGGAMVWGSGIQTAP